MQIIIQGKQTQITAQMRQRIERKLQRLSRFIDEDARVEVTVTEEQTRSAKDRFSVQLAISGTTHPIHSEVSALNTHTALDLVLDKVTSQLSRQKGRQTTQRRHGSSPVRVLALSRSGQLSSVEEEEQSESDNQEEEEQDGGDGYFASSVEQTHNEEIWSRVMEIRRLPTKPMNDQEVIAHMEESHAAFFPFFNAETNSVNVMYKLEQGGYGLLVPALEDTH